MTIPRRPAPTKPPVKDDSAETINGIAPYPGDEAVHGKTIEHDPTEGTEMPEPPEVGEGVQTETPAPVPRNYPGVYVTYKAFFSDTPPREDFALFEDFPDIRSQAHLNLVVQTLMKRHPGSTRVIVQNWKPIEA